MFNHFKGICYVNNKKYIETAREYWERCTNNSIMDYVVVANLPRNAFVEWHVWAHTHNNQFECKYIKFTDINMRVWSSI